MKITKTQFGSFVCLYCFTDFEEELPWLGDVELWPKCCGVDARLVVVCEKDDKEGREA